MSVTFQKDEAEAQFRADTPGQIETMSPAEGVAAMLAFWRDTHCEGTAPEDEDGDGLLFQWGTYDWTYSKPPKPKFHLSISRQLYFVYDASAGDIEIWHLRLEYTFADAPDLAALKSGQEWCFARGDLDRFRDYIAASDAFAAIEHYTPLDVEIAFSQA